MANRSTAVALQFPDSDALRYLPEGPYALSDATFSWVAIQHGGDAKHGSLNIYDLDSQKNQSFDLPGRPGFAFPCTTEGLFVVGCERSLGYLDTRSGRWQEICDGIDADVDNTIINDGIVIGDNLVFGCKDLEFKTQKAGLYLFRGRDQKLIRLRDDQICSNGKATRRLPDGGLQLIDIDSPTRTVVGYRLDLDAGTLDDPQVLLDLTDDPAVPDGAVLTPDGRGLIVAMFHPGGARHGETRWYDLHSGRLQYVWVTPASPQNTCPALVRVGEEIILVITTAVENMNEADRAAAVDAGRIFVAPTSFSPNKYEFPPRLKV